MLQPLEPNATALLPGSVTRSGAVSGQEQLLVYARHGRELMGCKSPMCEPDRRPHGSDRNISRRQGQLREGLSEGSPSAKL